MARTYLPAATAALLSLGGLVTMATPASAHPVAAKAKSSGTFEIRGGGFGHGIGMSQYGAMGYALHGWNAEAIIGHYYQDTSVATVANSTVTVLLQQGGAAFSGANAANGHKLSPTKTYTVVASGGRVALIVGGHSAGTFAAPLKVTGPNLTVAGKGGYAGSLEFYPDGSGVDTVNAVDLEDYVRGVIAEEMPAGWPLAALEAQAIAARSYVLADTPASAEYDVYSDTRSQMYGGLAAETATTNAAETATAGQVVEASGRIIPTYFFSSSGGHTESIQNVWLGVSAAPYLVGVSDPYDDSGDNPYYRWNDTMGLTSAGARLAGLYRGRFEGIKVLQRGVSPRVVSALVVGSRGSSTVSGATLEADLGTDSTWMSFTSLTAKGSVVPAPGAGRAAGTGSGSGSGSGSGGLSSGTGTSSSTGGSGMVLRLPGVDDLALVPLTPVVAIRRLLTGTVFPAAPGARVIVERQAADGRWVRVGAARVTAAGAYRFAVRGSGVYRAVFGGVPAPTVSFG